MLACLAKVKTNLSKKELKNELLDECLAGFTSDFLADQERSLTMALTNNIKDLAKIKDFSKKLVQQNDQLNQTELAVLNILEDSRELEKIIREERNKAQAIISSMGEGLLVVDNNYKVVLLNSISEKNLEISAKEIFGKDVRDVIKIDKGKNHMHEDIFKRVFELKKIIEIKLEDDFYYHIIPSDKKFPIAMVVAPLTEAAENSPRLAAGMNGRTLLENGRSPFLSVKEHPDPLQGAIPRPLERGSLKHENEIKGIVIIFRDITKEKKFDEARSSFISVASHQIRTPLTAIRWYTEMLKGGDAGPLTGEQKNFIDQIYGATLRLYDTLSTILSLSKVESGETKINFIKVDILKISKDILKEFELLFAEKKLKVNFETNVQDQPIEIPTDQSMFNQIFTNLLSNAIRYTNEGGTIQIKIEERGQEVLFSIKDNGIGIPEDQKGKIFEKFFRADNAIMKIADGSGLGLTLVKDLIELLRGRVWFESKEMKGTTFYFVLSKQLS